MNITITKMTSFTKNHRNVFKGDICNVSPVKYCRNQKSNVVCSGVSFKGDYDKEDDYIRISKEDVINARHNADRREIFTLILGMLIGGALGGTGYAIYDSENLKKVETPTEHKYKNDEVKIEDISFKDANKDGYIDVVLKNSDNSQTIMDFHNGVIHNKKEKAKAVKIRNRE